MSPPRYGGLFLEALRLDRWPPEEVLPRARPALEAGVGGFILFGGEAGTVRSLCVELRELAGRDLWLAADLERGAGQQFRGASELPPPRALAAHPEPKEAVRAAAGLTAREARGLGLNWALAPVLDLDAESRNPIVGTRSFGSDPSTVAELGRIWVEACQAEGVAACAKHFPGHGRTTSDSHLELPSVEAGREELEGDLHPFRQVADRVASVMTAHVAYPALGSPGAATFSPAVLRGLLRDEIGFGGLVVSDAMIMEGFREGEDAEGTAAVRALFAGCDLLLYPDDLRAAAAAVGRAAHGDPTLAARARVALDRSAVWLKRFAPPPAGLEAMPTAGEAEARREVLAAEAGGSGRALELAVACLRPRGPVDAIIGRWRPNESLEMLWLSDDLRTDAEGASAPGTQLAAGLRAAGWRVASPRPLEAREADESLPTSTGQRIVVVRSTPRAWKGRMELSSAALAALRRALRTAEPGLAVVLGHERLLEGLGVAGICAWSSEAVMERAVARWIARRRTG